MTVHPDPYVVKTVVQDIEDRVDRMLGSAKHTDFRGLVGQHYEGSPEYQESYEFASHINDADYDVFLLVKVRQ